MLFHEIYGSYYDAVATILRRAVEGSLTARELTALVREKAFSESLLAIPRGLQGEQWRLLRRDLTTPIAEAPAMPLTLLQKRWLKALLLDARIQLFAPDMTGLEDVEPLFTPDMFVYYDRYADGDDYADPAYIARFRTILRALREHRDLYLRFGTAAGRGITLVVTPRYMEYSDKDDRFRLAASGRKRDWVVNLSRMRDCMLAAPEGSSPGEDIPCRPARREMLTFELTDIRNGLERVMLHFSDLRKETERLAEGRYRVTLHYDRRDETELVIRVISFGPVIRVLAPARFVDEMKRRVNRQMAFATFLPGYEGERAIESRAKGAGDAPESNGRTGDAAHDFDTGTIQHGDLLLR